MPKAEREARRTQWAEIIEQWRNSSLSKASFCRKNNLQVWQFHYWFGRLGQAAEGNSFARVEDADTCGLTLRFPSGLALEVAPDFDERSLARFLAVAARSC